MQSSNSFCEFCQILYHKDINKDVIAENEHFFAFHDIDDAGAQAHVLVCTKKHIQSALHLKTPQTAFQMREFGKQVLTELYKQRHNKKPSSSSFRFGFHLPPFISVYHIHLHCFILPFRKMAQERIKYGFGGIFKSVEELAQQLISGKPSI